jgi:YVTN family beta-propeller protein
VRSRAFRSIHGAAADPDGRRIYISSEAEQALHVVDGKTLQTTKKIPLTGRPNNISIAKRRQPCLRRHRLRAGCGGRDRHEDARAREEHSDEGRDSQRLRHARREARDRGSIAGRLMTVIDQKTDQPLWTLFEQGVRPMAFELNPDGSTRAHLRAVVGFPWLRDR